MVPSRVWRWTCSALYLLTLEEEVLPPGRRVKSLFFCLDLFFPPRMAGAEKDVHDSRKILMVILTKEEEGKQVEERHWTLLHGWGSLPPPSLFFTSVIFLLSRDTHIALFTT